MKYYVQSFKDKWKTIGDPTGVDDLRGYDDLNQAYESLKRNAKMARMIWPMRIVDSDEVVYYTYDPDRDTRLPLGKHKAIEKAAYHLWEKAGCPHGKSSEFWLKAESELIECDGIFSCVFPLLASPIVLYNEIVERSNSTPKKLRTSWSWPMSEITWPKEGT